MFIDIKNIQKIMAFWIIFAQLSDLAEPWWEDFLNDPKYGGIIRFLKRNKLFPQTHPRRKRRPLSAYFFQETNYPI